MKITSLRRVVAALVVAAGVAALPGVWFAGTSATVAGPNDARIRVMHWDEYQRVWVGSYIARPTADNNFTLDAIRSAEGTIVELRPEASGASLEGSSLPAFVDVLTAQDLADLGIPEPAATPLDNNGTPLPNLLAQGAPTFARLRVSRPDYISTARPTTLGPDEVWAGPLDGTAQDVDAGDIDGSVGIHTVTLATAGTTDNIQFLWDIGRWAKGDILLGVNNGTYKVLDKNGEFKRFIGSQDYGRVVNAGTDFEDYPNEFTTGCAANWRTAEFYATNFSYEDPAINIFARHPGASGDPGYLRPYVNATRRISTAAYRRDDIDDTDPRSPIDKNPESVVFDADLNMYVGHSFPYFGGTPDGWSGVPSGWWGEGDWAWGVGWPAYEWGINGKPIAFNEGGWPWLTDESGNLLMMRRQDMPAAALRAWQYGFTSARMEHTADRSALAPFITLGTAEFPELAAPISVPQAYFADPVDGEWLVDGSGNKVPVVWPLGKRLHRYINQTPGAGQAPTFNTANRNLYWTFTSQQGTDAIDITSNGVIYYTSEDSYVHRYDPNGNGGQGLQLPDVGGFKLGVEFGGVEELKPRRYSGLRLLPPGDGTGGFLVAGGDGVYRYDQDGRNIQKYQVRNDPDVGGLLQSLYALDIDPGGRTFWAFANFDSGWIYQFDIASGRELKRLPAVEYVPIYDESRGVGVPELPTGRRIEGVCVMWEYTAAQEACGNGLDDDGDGLVDESCTPIEYCGNAIDEDGDGRSDNNDPDCGAELPPVAGDDAYTTREDQTLVVDLSHAAKVMINDFDPDNDPSAEGYDPRRVDTLSVARAGASGTPSVAAGTSFQTANGGTVTLEATGRLTYVPATNFHGVDTFVYLVNDGLQDSNVATVTITVVPEVADDSYTMNEGTVLTVAGLATSPNGILVNDSNAPLTIIGAGATAGALTALGSSGYSFQTANLGTVTITADGNFTYNPNGYVGVDTFFYRAHDGLSTALRASDLVAPFDTWARVTITVLDVNEVIANDDGVFETGVGVARTMTVVGNDRDPERHPFTVTHINGTPVTIGGPAVTTTNGTAALTAAGQITFTPAGGFWGTTTFEYTITDQPGEGVPVATDTAVVTVRVVASDLTLADDHYQTRLNQTLSVPAPGMLMNDTNRGLPVGWVTDGAGVSAPLVSGTITNVRTQYGGTVTVNGDGSFVYTPAINFQGVDTYRYLIQDDLGNWKVATVFIRVLGEATVIAGGGSKVFGTPDPALSAISMTGFLAGDLPNITFTQARATGEVVGTYAVTATATAIAADGTPLIHYIVNYVPGVFTISKAPSTTTVTGGIFPYDGTPKPQTCAVQGVNAQGVMGPLPGGTITYYTQGGAALPGAPTAVGEYTVKCVYDGDPNHFGSEGENTIRITPLRAVVIAGSGTKVYGTMPDPALSAVTTTGFVNGDAATLTLGQSRAAGENVGEYVTTATASGAVLANYAVDYVEGEFTITPAPLVIRANDKLAYVGTPMPALDGSITGIRFGDAITATYSTVGTTAVAGSWPIVPAAVDPDGKLSNYTVQIINGTLTVLSEVCNANGYITYSQGGWGSKPSGGNPGALLAQHFQTVYPNGLILGGTHTLRFTSASAIERYLPAGGSARVLTSSETNPTSSKGVLSAQLLAVQLAADFSKAGVFKRGMGNLVFTSGPVAGQTLDAVLAMANAVFGGNTSALPAGMTVSGLASLLESVVNNYHEGTVNLGLLGCGAGGGSPDPDPEPEPEPEPEPPTTPVCAFRTQSQGGWGSSPSGSNPGAFLAQHFSSVFGSTGVVVGGSYKLTLTSVEAVQAFLPAGGTASKLKKNLTNPTSSPAGVFAGQVVALQISVAFSDAGITQSGLGALVIGSGPLAGKTVAQVLAWANTALGGGSTPYSISTLNSVVDAINNNFVDGTRNEGYLVTSCGGQ